MVRMEIGGTKSCLVRKENNNMKEAKEKRDPWVSVS